MTDPDTSGKGSRAQPPGRDLLPLPALAFISLYLLALAAVIVLGVVAGRHYPPLFLLFAACFISASAGLLLLLRWAWALALAAVFLLAVYNLWIFASLHQGAALVQGLLNLVFFLYLVRPEVRERLR
ncbi:MAG: hypothetical protein ABR924_01025 [Terracidiphilus sp.]|jgi:hypothetical protein